MGRKSEENERSSFAESRRLVESTTSIGLELDIGYVPSPTSGGSSASRGAVIPSLERCTMTDVGGDEAFCVGMMKSGYGRD